MYVEFGGGRSTACELVKMVEPEDVTDGKIEVIGLNLLIWRKAKPILWPF